MQNVRIEQFGAGNGHLVSYSSLPHAGKNGGATVGTDGNNTGTSVSGFPTEASGSQYHTLSYVYGELRDDEMQVISG